MKPIEIIICDDQPLIIEGLQRFIQQQPMMKIKAIAESGAELILKLRTCIADILLLDIDLHDINGADLCLTIKREFPEIRILVISNINQRSIILRMLQNGVSGYLLKSESIKEIEQAIFQIFEGGVYFGTETQKILSAYSDKELNNIPAVTPREKEVLTYLAEGLTTPEIAKNMFISQLTVDSHRKNLLKKFDTNKTVNLIQLARDMSII